MYKPFFCLAMAVSLLGCHPEENPEQLKMVNQSLERINENMKSDNKNLIERIKYRLNEPHAITVARRVLPEVNKIHLYADSLLLMLYNIKNELNIQSNSLKIDYVTIVRELHNEDGVGSRLFNKLAVFKDSIPALINLTEPSNRKYIPKDITLLPTYVDSLPANEKLQFGKKWCEESFGRSSSLMVMIMLNKIENDVLATEKILIEYCNSSYTIEKIIYDDQYEPLVVLSSTYVKKGQPVEITTGVFKFSDDMKPRIQIDGKEIELKGRDCCAVHKFTADGNRTLYNGKDGVYQA
jgi:hypothetical protein